jgi:uncharacterized protein (TIGR00295 family)
MVTEKQAINLLKKHSPSKKQFKAVLKHAVVVKNLSLKIAKRIKNKKINNQFLKSAALLHDIGRFVCSSKKNSAFHGVEGAKILRKEKLPKHARVAENHLGSGITKSEARRIGLPAKDYLPETIEEKIICYADSLVFQNTKIKDLAAVLKRYKKFGKGAVERTMKLHEELRSI